MLVLLTVLIVPLLGTPADSAAKLLLVSLPTSGAVVTGVVRIDVLDHENPQKNKEETAKN